MKKRMLLACMLTIVGQVFAAERTQDQVINPHDLYKKEQQRIEESLPAVTLNGASAQRLAQLLEKLDKWLSNPAAMRAVRPDSPGADDPALPPFPFDSADLDMIRQCVCIIKEQLRTICSKIDVVISIVDESGSQIDVIESKIDAIDTVVGELADSGTCFAAIIVEADIDNAELTVVGWLKTLMKEIRGVCP